MTSHDSLPDEAITEEEIQGADASREARKPRNAFTELMKPKPKPERHAAKSKSAEATSNPHQGPFGGRMGLGAYLVDPGSYPSTSRIIYHTDDFVVINDMFPKATVHALLLPRSETHNLLHPFDALADPAFLAQVRREAAKVRVLAAKELRRKIGSESVLDARREAVLNGEAEPDDADPGGLPGGRDWEREIMCGVHAVPSMSHLHVHVLSRDMRSACLKHRRHYSSFRTPFFVDLDDFPLARDDPRRDTRRQGYLDWELRCWRCRETFGHRFQKLKGHLEEEFEEWRRE